MKRLLYIELQKIWLNKASRVLIFTYFILLSFIAMIAAIKFNIGISKIQVTKMGVFDFPYIWHFNTYIAAFLKLFLAIVFISMMTNEYSFGTLKQNLIDGLSKKEFILTKFLSIVFLSLLSTLFVFVMTLILGYSFSTKTNFSIVFSDLDYLLAFFVKLLGFFSFCLFLAILVKRSAFALAFLLVWNIVEGVIKGVLAYKIFPEGKTADNLTQFLPMEAMSNLIVEPFTRTTLVKEIGSQMGVENLKDYGVHFASILIVLSWVFIFNLMSYQLLKNRDL